MKKPRDEQKLKIMVTGGHLAPALAVIDELIKQKGNSIEIIFVGRKYANEREKTPSLEYQEIKKRNICFKHIRTGRFTRVMSVSTILDLLKVPSGFLNAFKILRKEKPNIILSFGSYIAVPIAVIGHQMKIPVYTHEQTIHPGIANKVIARYAQLVFVSFPESKKLLPSKKIIVTGNPIRELIFEKNKPAFAFKKTKPVIYITGGSLGSHSINVHIEKLLPQLLEKYTLIHQTGNVKEYNDYERLSKKASELPDNLKHHYIVRPHIMAEEVGYVYDIADVVISRSGANTFFELVILQKPAVLIPLPWSGHQEQQKQAKILKEAGVAEIFEQKGKSEQLLKMIEQVYEQREEYADKFEKLTSKYPTNASQTIITKILS
jgi:UDP-N-acetylglucosamine--N-acetylmuramyl-(pentapeptide) pyrophosphoryl-undecaprenol N-acetylglucosamine transferase